MPKPVPQSKLNLAVIILCPNRNMGDLKITVRSIVNACYDRPILAVVSKDTKAKEIKELQAICPVCKGGDTVTSLINAGMNNIEAEWGFIIYSGSVVKMYVERKLERFVTSERDILFPIVDCKLNFVEGSSNGLLINKKVFQEIGNWPTIAVNSTINDFEYSKAVWALDAISKGVIFKGIMGLRIV